eukprot:1740022-Alexandrium_andersonii.AAC.1
MAGGVTKRSKHRRNSRQFAAHAWGHHVRPNKNAPEHAQARRTSRKLTRTVRSSPGCAEMS